MTDYCLKIQINDRPHEICTGIVYQEGDSDNQTDTDAQLAVALLGRWFVRYDYINKPLTIEWENYSESNSDYFIFGEIIDAQNYGKSEQEIDWEGTHTTNTGVILHCTKLLEAKNLVLKSGQVIIPAEFENDYNAWISHVHAIPDKEFNERIREYGTGIDGLKVSSFEPNDTGVHTLKIIKMTDEEINALNNSSSYYGLNKNFNDGFLSIRESLGHHLELAHINGLTKVSTSTEGAITFVSECMLYSLTKSE